MADATWHSTVESFYTRRVSGEKDGVRQVRIVSAPPTCRPDAEMWLCGDIFPFKFRYGSLPFLRNVMSLFITSSIF